MFYKIIVALIHSKSEIFIYNQSDSNIQTQTHTEWIRIQNIHLVQQTPQEIEFPLSGNWNVVYVYIDIIGKYKIYLVM